MKTFFFFFPQSKDENTAKTSSEFYLHLARFKKYFDKFKLSLSLKNYFGADTPNSSPHDFVFFSLAFSFSNALCLLELLFVSRFNPIYISNLHSTWVPWQSALYFSMKQSEKSR